MRVIRFFVLCTVLLVGAGCEVRYVQPPTYVFTPRQFEQIQEGNAGRRVWVYSRGSRELRSPISDIEATVGDLIESACGLTMVQRFEGSVPAHRFRLQIDQTLTSQTEDLGCDRRVRYQL